MTRFDLRSRSAHALSVGLLGLAGCGSDPAPVRGVLLVVVDTLRADHTSLAEYGLDTTPRLAGFAAEHGVEFTEARSTSSWTKPSVASILTGLDPRAHGVLTHIDALHGEHDTLPEVFARRGWQTLAVQSNLYLLGKWGFGQGFERYADALSEGGAGTIAPYDTSTGERVNEVALQWIDERDPDRPFFLYVHHYEPHHRYLRHDLVPEDAFGVPLERRELLSSASMNDLVGAVDQITANDALFFAARYDSEILYQDALIGRLLDGLEQRGLLHATLVAITADHGEEFLEHGGISHGNDKLVDVLLRVPLVIALPGRAPGQVIEPVSLRDLGRTLLDLSGLAEEEFPGRSMSRLLRGEGEPSSFHVVAHGMLPERPGGVRTERDTIVQDGWKLVRDLVDGDRRLYDLREDPGESVDRFEGERDRAKELERALDAFVEEDARAVDLGPDDARLVEERERYLRENAQRFEDLGYL